MANKLAFGALVTLPIESSILDPLLHEVKENGAVIRHNEVGLLLNVKYLEQRIGPDNVREYLRSHQPRHVPSNLDGVSDEYLLKYCKSRGIQTLADLSHYAESLCRCAQNVRDYSSQVRNNQDKE